MSIHLTDPQPNEEPLATPDVIGLGEVGYRSCEIKSAQSPISDAEAGLSRIEREAQKILTGSAVLLLLVWWACADSDPLALAMLLAPWAIVTLTAGAIVYGGKMRRHHAHR